MGLKLRAFHLQGQAGAGPAGARSGVAHPWWRVLPARLWSRVATHPVDLAALLAFLLNAFLVSADFFPNLREINAWDEAVYVDSGRQLIEGEWPAFSNNPLVALFYALTYLPFADSPFWLVHSTSLGRVLLFASVWLGAYAVARRLAPLAHPLVMAGLLIVSAIPVSLLSFPSDPLYVGLAAMSLAQVVGYIETDDRKHLWRASLFIGLAALARNDGLVLGFVLIGLPLILARSRREAWRAALASAAPFAALVGGYVLFFGLLTGRFELGTQQRTYDNFEAGHQVIYAGEGQVNPVLEAKLEARRVFGTPEENRNSVVRAILRNPQAYLARLLTVARALPAQLLAAYGKRAAVPIFLLALRGAWELLRRRRFRLLSALAVWPVPLLSGFLITLFRAGHLQFPFYVVYGLAAIGALAAVRNLGSRKEQAFWALGLLLFALYGVLDNKLAISYGALVALAGLGLGLWARASFSQDASGVAVPCLLLLAGGLLLHGDYPGPKVRTLGEAPDERAVLFLQEHFEPGTPVAAGSPGPVYAARMTYMGLASLDVPRGRSPQEFLDWMVAQRIQAVYVDASLSYANPFYWEQISSLVGAGLERVFAAEEGDIQVLLLNE